MLLVESPTRRAFQVRFAALVRRQPWRVVVVLATAACLLGWLPFATRPLSPDEGGLLMVARQWAPGDSLYGNYWVDRPPILIALVRVGDLMGGASGLRALGVIAVFASVLLAGALGRVVSPREPMAPVLPAATASLLLTTPLFGGSVVNAEVLGMPLLLCGMVAAIASTGAATVRKALWWGIAAGSAGAGAFLIKQNLLDVFVLLGALLIIGSLRQRGREGVRTVAATLLGAALGGGIVVGCAVAGAAALGTGPVELWSAVIAFRGEAAGVVLGSPATGHRFRLMLLALLCSGAPLLVGVLLVRQWRRSTTTPAQADLRLAVLAVLVWECVAVLGGGSYWLHYLMVLVPGLVLLAAVSGWPVDSRRSVGLAYACAAASTLCVIGWVAVFPIDRSEQAVASYLAARAETGDTAVVAFGVPSILESAGLDSPYPNLWSLPVRVHDPELHAFAAVLSGPERPTWLVISGMGLGSWGLDTSAAQPYIGLHYERIADVAGYRIFRESETTP